MISQNAPVTQYYPCLIIEYVYACVLAMQSCSTLCDPTDCSLLYSSVHRILQERMLEKVAISFLQGIFPTQGLNLGLPHCGQILNCLSYQGHFKYTYLEPLFQCKLGKQVLRLLPEDIRAGLRFMCTSTHKHIHIFYAYLLCISHVYFRYIDVYYVYLLFKCVFMSSANSDGFTSFPIWMNEFCHLQ